MISLTDNLVIDMPAKTVLFDQRVRSLHDFGMAPHNFILFNPQGRLVALAGFGNLAGKIDIFDRRTLAKVITIEAPNTSFCDWSPDGRFLLTATLSPRLRVDNGIKIWHCSGPLIHVEQIEELYHAAWRPTPLENVSQFGSVIPPAPAPNESVKALTAEKPTPTKPAGAYRPPGARGHATPSIFKREDEGGPGTYSGSATPPRFSRSPVPGAPGYGQRQNGHTNGDGYLHQQNGGRRYVPGASPLTSPGLAPEGPKNRKKKKKQDGVGTVRPSTPGEEGGVSDGVPIGVERGQIKGKRQDGQGQGSKRSGKKGVNSEPQVGAPQVPPTPPVPADLETDVSVQPPDTDAASDLVAKKARNLNKKVCPLRSIFC